MEYRPDRFREYFPALETGTFFDNAGGTQTPIQVAQAIVETLAAGVSQRGHAYAAARNSDRIVLQARAAMGDLLNAPAEGIVFGRSASALIFDFARMLTADLVPGDEIIISRLDHDANIRPWILAAQAVGATIRFADFDPQTADLPVSVFETLITSRTKLLSVTAASNLYGTMPDIPAIARLARGVGAVMFVDGVAYVPHELPSVTDLGADYFVCSPYKFFGPHLGVLSAQVGTLEKLQPAKLLPSPNTVPERFEHGTLPYELLAAVSATVDFLAGFSSLGSRRARLAEFYTAAGRHEYTLAQKIIAGLTEIPGVTRHGNPTRGTPTVLFSVRGASPEQVAQFLGEKGIGVSAGNFYAHEAALWAGLHEGAVRLSLAPYNTADEVDRLLTALRDFVTR